MYIFEYLLYLKQSKVINGLKSKTLPVCVSVVTFVYVR